MWPCKENLNDFLPLLNNLAPSIKFTVENENEGKLPFLDCTVHRVERAFKFSIYRKPTNVCSYIHFYSAHQNKVKVSAFSSMFLRALRICSPEFLDEEIDNIYCIATKLKYPKTFIEKSLNQAKKTFYRTNALPSHNKKNLLILPYSEKFDQVPHLMKKFDVNVVFSNTSTVKNMLIKNSPENSVGCIYKIPCKRCNKIYVGQTGKELNTRVKQHKYSVRTGQESNALFVHMRDEDHCIDWDNASPILCCKSVLSRNIVESSIIKNTESVNMNLSCGMYKLDKFITEKNCSQVKIS